MNGTVLVPVPPTPDRMLIRKHLGLIAADERQGLVEIAWTDEQGNLSFARQFLLGELEAAADEAAKLNRNPGVNIYVGAALRREETNRNRRAKAADVLGTRVLWFDADDNAAEAVEKALESRVEPSALITTGSVPHLRMHGYWQLAELLTDHGAITAQLKAIAARLGTDRAVTDPPRVLRLAGGVAWPKKVGRVPELVSYRATTETPSATSLASLKAVYPPDVAAPRSSRTQRPSPSATERATSPATLIVTPRLLAELRDALGHIEADGYYDWQRIGHALKTLGDAGRGLWHDWSATSEEYKPDQAEAKWKSFKPERTGYGAIFAEAQRLGWRNPAARADGAQGGGAGRSEEDLALAFARENEAGLRYCAVWDQWLAWDGVRWAQDKTLLATDLARELCRRAARAALSSDNPRAALVLGAARTVAALERLARADRRLAATVEQWDADPWLLNTPGGVVDLKTGKIRPSDPALHMMMVTGATPAQGGAPTIFLGFLDRITGGDKDLRAYLQRVFGYALTGLTSAHALFFGYGTGSNGKSVLMDTAASIFGDYHKTAPIETFTESRGDRHPTEMAMLRGARLVTASETEEGRRWAESRIKTLTGGDLVAARLMRQDFFQFAPQFKLFIAGNHRPGLRSVDEAMRRRFHLIPFAVTIPAAERDEGLKDKLRAEWPEILAWMIEGCLEWQRLGLAPPGAVRAATNAYMESEDRLSAWIEEDCERDPQAWEPASALFRSWSNWATAHGEHAGPSRGFAQSLEVRGFGPQRRPQARGVLGLRLKKTNDFREIEAQ
jgi:putative DNA primase/helicase